MSPCDREELRESPGPAPPAWGHDGSQRLAGTGQLGVPGVLEGPIFPQGSGGLTGCFSDLQPSPGSGVSCICRLVPRVPPSSRHVPPSLWVPRGAHRPLPGDPRPLSPPCAVPCHALPRCLGGHLSHIPPAPHPAETPGSGVRGAPSPGRAPTSLPAPACCPALFPGGKKQWKFSRKKGKKKKKLLHNPFVSPPSPACLRFQLCPKTGPSLCRDASGGRCQTCQSGDALQKIMFRFIKARG